MSTFVNSTARISTTHETVYTSAGKSILIGCNLANITGSILPCDVVLRQSTGDTYVIKNKRVANGESAEVMRGNKLVLHNGDMLLVKTDVANGFDVILSMLEGV
jgi:hypothetical protein